MSSTVNLDAERALLGCVLVDSRALDDVVTVDPADFHDPRHESLWGLVMWLAAQRKPTDPVTVLQNLGRVDNRAITGEFLHDVVAAAPPKVQAHHYSELVAKAAHARRLEAAGRRIQQLAADGVDPDEAQEVARAEVDACPRATSSVTVVSEEIDAFIDSLAAEAPKGHPSPWPDLNYYLPRGFAPGRMYVVGARPSVGKSILGLQLAVHLARYGHSAFYSLEMDRSEVNIRILAQLSGVTQDEIANLRTLAGDQAKKVSHARGRLASLPISVDDRSNVRPVDIRSHARTLSRRGPLSGLVVDYLQLMAATRGDKRPRHEQIGDWSRQLKLLSKELEVPVIVLSQLNRDIERRADSHPTLADLRESGSIEQDADVVLLLHAEGPDDPEVGVGVAKNRQGKTGAFKLARRGEIARLDSQERRFS